MHADAVPWLAIVGIGEDGVDALAPRARAALDRAERIVGSRRIVELLPPALAARAQVWPSPMLPFLDELLARERGRPVAVVASGDPMFFGVGGSIARRVDAREFAVFAQPSCVSLACARMGWAQDETVVVSLVNRPLAQLLPELLAGRRIVVLSEDGTTPATLASHLAANGLGATVMHAFEALGGPHERRIDGVAHAWPHARIGDLNVVALTVAAGTGDAAPLPCVPGLPDDTYAHDGALTKRDARAITLGRLAPRPGELLWDIGAGAGSIAIEWLRAHPACRAIAFERDPVRAERIAHNARTLGVPRLRVVVGSAPGVLADEQRPDAIFIGGGVSQVGVLPVTLAALPPGGRLVANAVTLAGERTLLAAHARLGGDLLRIDLAHAAPVGGMLAWRPALPLVQWSYVA